MDLMVVKGKNLEVNDALRTYVQRKLEKLDRHLEGTIETTVELSRENTRSQQGRYVVQITMMVGRTILRAEERAAEAHAAVDAVVDVIDRQIERFKGKRRLNRHKGGQAKISDLVGPPEEVSPPLASEDLEETLPGPYTGKVVKRKVFAMKPMSYEEAAEQMELLGHDFFLFLDAASGLHNVIYRRQDGDYGLIAPGQE